MAKVTVIGSANTDLIVQTPRLPAAGETVLGSSFRQMPGGKGANQAVAAARAGATVTFAACVGMDDLGDAAIAGWTAEGINTAFVHQTPEANSGVALIMVDDAGENCIAVASGANTHFDAARVRAVESAIASADIALLQLEIPLDAVMEALNIAAKHRIPVILNPAPVRALPARAWQHIAYLTPNSQEASALAALEQEPSLADALLKKGPRAVITTLGAEGALLTTARASIKVSGHQVDVVDSTGAGDAFNGALATALAEGSDIENAVRFANAAAALSVSHLGAQSAPERTQIESFVQKL